VENLLELLKRRIGRYDQRAERIQGGALPEAIHYQRDDRELDEKLLKALSAR